MRTWRTTIGALGALTLVAACGGDDGEAFADQPVEDIVAAVEADMKALTSLRMAGDITTGGQDLTIDLTVSTSGDCEGSIAQDGATAEILSVGGESFMKPDAAFWEMFAGPSAATIIDAVGDDWVQFPAEQGDFSDFCNLEEFMEDLGGDKEPEDTTVEGTEELDGREAVRLSSTSEDDEPVTLWVAADAPHVILQMEVTEGDEPGRITFSDFDEDLALEAPPEDEVVDLGDIG